MLKLYGHVKRREKQCVVRMAIEIKVQGRRTRGRSKRSWLDRARGDIK